MSTSSLPVSSAAMVIAPPAASSSSSCSSHRSKYKNAGLDAAEMRRRREEEGVQIRKAKREEQLFKRRNVNKDDAEEAEDGPDQVRIKRKEKNKQYISLMSCLIESHYEDFLMTLIF
jgi:hypothetical protein